VNAEEPRRCCCCGTSWFKLKRCRLPASRQTFYTTWDRRGVDRADVTTPQTRPKVARFYCPVLSTTLNRAAPLIIRS
jgi:hypothetical protein